MAREPDVALLIMASGSFVDKHKLAHIKKKICAHKILKAKIITVLRRKSRNHSQIQSKDLFFRDHYVFETKIKKSESIVNKTNFTPQKSLLTDKFLPTHIQLKIGGTLLTLMEIHIKLCSFYGSLTQKGSRPLSYI